MARADSAGARAFRPHVFGGQAQRPRRSTGAPAEQPSPPPSPRPAPNASQQAESARETVVVFSHVPAHPDSTSRECADACLIWNFDEVLQILRRHKSVVRVFFAGHDHFGGYARDQGSGIHFVTLQGVIETALNDNAYATVEVFRDRVLVNGKGRQARAPRAAARSSRRQLWHHLLRASGPALYSLHC